MYTICSFSEVKEREKLPFWLLKCAGVGIALIGCTNSVEGPHKNTKTELVCVCVCVWLF